MRAAPPPESRPMEATIHRTARTGIELLTATRPFAGENRVRSWWYLWTALLVALSALTVSAVAPYWWVKLPAAIFGALAMVRGFIVYHDYMHGAILRKSRLAKVLMHAFGLLFLTPAYHWRISHNFHHANVGKIEGSNTGSYPVMTVEQWQRASIAERLFYRLARHPLTILTAYLTVFVFSNCLLPALRNPKKEWTGLLALAVHGGLVAGLWMLGAFWMAFWGWILPYAVATAVGAYLFYAQHNFPGMKIIAPGDWTMSEAALKSCSYLKLGPFMSWFTGDIGYHHVHHLNAGIPFYRLEEAMKALPEAQSPAGTSLHPRDIIACFRLKVWDETNQEMVSYRKARRTHSTTRTPQGPQRVAA